MGLPPGSTVRVPLGECQRTLALLWLVASGLLFVLLLAQTSLGHYGDSYADAWNWLLPAVLPTASLIVTVLFKTTEAEQKTADRFLFRLCYGLSLTYLLTLILVLLLQPFQTGAAAEALKHSNIYLGPFQGLVASSIGAFFVQTEKTK